MRIIQGDISEEAADAVAASAFGDWRRRHGADSAVYRRGGTELRAFRAAVGYIDTGAAVATAAGRALRCRTVVHAVPPQWHGGGKREEETLRRCYREALEAARWARCRTVAFPLLGTGLHGVPPEVSLRTALDELGAEEDRGGLACTLVLSAEEARAAAKALFGEIGDLLGGGDAGEEDSGRPMGDEDVPSAPPPRWKPGKRAYGRYSLKGGGDSNFHGYMERLLQSTGFAAAVVHDLAKRVDNVGPGVGKALMALMNQKHFDNRKLMLKTGISKQLLSKIQNGKHAKAPEKRWLLAFSVAMGLTLGETREFLATAGYALSKASKVDVVVEYFLARGGARIEDVDAALACYGLPTLYPPDLVREQEGA